MPLKTALCTIGACLVLLSCQNLTKSTLVSIEANTIAIDSQLTEVDTITSFVAPYRKRINEVLDSVLAYAPNNITKNDGEYNTSAGNLMADIIYSEANPIYKERTGNDIDFVLLNHGGIRADISKGNVTARTAYEVMPFENNIVVVDLPGKNVLNMVDYLIKSKRPHPVSHIQITLDSRNELNSLYIDGALFDVDRTYHVATSDYLVTGGDNMIFFKGMTGKTDTDYLIRNAMVDYFSKVDTLKATVDNRFLKLD